LVENATEQFELCDEVGGRGGSGTHPAVAETRSTSQCHRHTGTEPKGRMRFLGGLRFHRDVGKLPEFAAHSCAPLGPRAFITWMPSTNRSPRCSLWTPKTGSGMCEPPIPTPTVIRPLLN